MDLPPFTLALISLSSLIVFLAVLISLRSLIRYATLQKDDRAQQRDFVRWNYLRKNSALFRSAEFWVIPVSKWLDVHAAWVLEEPRLRTKFVVRAGVRMIQCVIGSPRTLEEATRIMALVQPFRTPEVIAAATLVGSLASVGMFAVLLERYATWSAVGLAAAFGVAVLRLQCWLFIRKAHEYRRSVRQLLPHAMDTVAMTVASGLQFRDGVACVVRDFGDHPLGREFARLHRNLNGGQPLSAALHTSASSLCLPEFDEFTRIVGRVTEHGATGADSFGRLAKQMRLTYFRHLEEAVGRAEASLSLPIMLVMVACMLVSIAPFAMSLISINLLP